MPSGVDLQKRPNQAAGSSIVFLGSFNPSIFQPAWLMRHQLIADEPDSQNIEVVSQPITSFTFEWLRVIAQPEKLELHASDEAPSPKALVDLASGIFDLLPHIPVGAFGINQYVHFSVETREAYDAIGFRLFNREVWEGVLENPRMRAVAIENRHGDFDHPNRITTVNVQPSTVTKQAVFVTTNDHFPRKEVGEAAESVQKLKEVFDDVMRDAGSLIDHVRML